MNYDPEFVELIVQEVIRRLRAAGGVTLAPTQGVGAQGAPVELALAERLVTLATISGRLEGIRRVLVQRRSVVTPAVRDELRARGIELRREGGCESPR